MPSPVITSGSHLWNRLKPIQRIHRHWRVHGPNWTTIQAARFRAREGGNGPGTFSWFSTRSQTPTSPSQLKSQQSPGNVKKTETTWQITTTDREMYFFNPSSSIYEMANVSSAQARNNSNYNIHQLLFMPLTWITIFYIFIIKKVVVNCW